jgi:SAM-dependent methyltransferase
MNNSFACRTCGSKEHSLFTIAQDLNLKNSRTSFEYYRCDFCSTIFLHPVPDNLSFYYAQKYPAYTINHAVGIEKKLYRLEVAKLKIVQTYATSGNLVEIGPASGRFLAVANQAGFNVLGIEQDSDSVQRIRDDLKLEAIFSSEPATKLKQLSGEFDVVVAWHALEHIGDLMGFAGAIADALRRPHGVLVLSTPNPNAWSFKIFRRLWVHLDAPRHLNLVPLFALDRLLASHGLYRVGCTYTDPVGLQLNKMGWQNSMMNLSRNDKLRWPWLAIVGRLLSVPMTLIDLLPGRGAAYTVAYRYLQKTDK